MGTSSPAGYIYPALWLQDHYSKGISDLSSAVQSDSYASAFARLASGQVDVLVTYADARRDYAERWNTEFNREPPSGRRPTSSASPPPSTTTPSP